MFTAHKVSFSQAGVLGSLVSDYLLRKEELKNFSGFYPDNKGFEELFKSNVYAEFDRKNLFEIALAQSKRVNNTSEQTLANIGKLSEKNVFTVTTGHQLCLFTGPLYFIYKILSAVNLAETLGKEFPSSGFVPVYWMASEDHDFEEVASFNLFGKTVKWESAQKGAVGDFETNELQSLLPQVKEIFGNLPHASELLNLFEKAYLGHTNLADATRYLVNELLGEFGVVVIDGNDPSFKKQFIAEFKKDIFDNLAFSKASESIEALKRMGYDVQVNPRPINCFYIEKGLRARIEKTEKGFALVGTERHFSVDEMNALVETNPEKISPNVVMRPMYQQVILPNVAYVGGPGELAYWLEYKSMFNAFGLNFPVLVPRNFLLVLDKAVSTKMGKLGFSLQAIFKSEQELISQYQVAQNAVFDLNEEKEKLSVFYNQISEKTALVDKSLAGTVQAEMQKALNGFDAIGGKANKALKQKLDTEIGQIKNSKQKLFPQGVPQERHDNFSAFYLKYGKNFIRELKQAIEGYSRDLKLLEEI